MCGRCTWLQLVFDPRHEVVLPQQQLVVEVWDGQVTQNAHALQLEVVRLLLLDGIGQVADVVLYQRS